VFTAVLFHLPTWGWKAGETLLVHRGPQPFGCSQADPRHCDCLPPALQKTALPQRERLTAGLEVKPDNDKLPFSEPWARP